MRVQINTFGTEGDIRPFVALARGLTSAGHQAAVCTSTGYAPMVTGGGVEHLPMDDTARALIKTVMPTIRGPASSIRVVQQMLDAMRQMMQDEWAAARAWRPDLIVYHPKCLGALHIAERLDVPAAASLSLPFFTPTGAFPIPFIGHWRLGPRANRPSYSFNNVTMLAYGSMINAFRGMLGLPRRPADRQSTQPKRRPPGSDPVLVQPPPRACPRRLPRPCPCDRAVVPAQPAAWQPPPDLEHFLAAGDPPVYLGFGSMGFGRRNEERTRLLLSVLSGNRSPRDHRHRLGWLRRPVRTICWMTTFMSSSRFRTTGCSHAPPPSSTMAAPAPPSPDCGPAAPP